MQIDLCPPTDLISREAKLFDLHAEYGLAYLVERDDRQGLFVNDELWYAWPKQYDHPSLCLKWLDRDRVILYLGGRDTAVLSHDAGAIFNFGYVYQLFVSANYIFVGFGDEDIYRPNSEDDPEFYGQCVYTYDGYFEFGLRILLEKALRNENWPAVLNVAYCCNDSLIFHADVEDCIRILDVATPSLNIVPAPSPLYPVDVLSGDDKTAFAICNRRQHHTLRQDSPPLRLIAFDLVAGTSAEKDVTFLERFLIDAGFDVDQTRFQPNASGRIIVTDGAKAALLDITEA